jgi:hypothetical protein
MKKSELKQIIKEEIRKVLNENELPDLRVGDYVKVRTKSGEVMGIVTTVNRDGYFYQQVKNVGDAANPYNRGGMVDGTNFITKMNEIREVSSCCHRFTSDFKCIRCGVYNHKN